MNEDLLKAGNAFSKWGPKEVEVLDSLPKCGSLLAWLGTNIRDRSDLKTFYDLATIAAGESDHELDRVTHFYQVELRIHILFAGMQIQPTAMDRITHERLFRRSNLTFPKIKSGHTSRDRMGRIPNRPHPFGSRCSLASEAPPPTMETKEIVKSFIIFCLI